MLSRARDTAGKAAADAGPAPPARAAVTPEQPFTPEKPFIPELSVVIPVLAARAKTAVGCAQMGGAHFPILRSR